MKTTIRFIVLLALVVVQALVPVSAQARAGSTRTASMPQGLYNAFLDAAVKDAAAIRMERSGYSLESHDLRVQLNAGRLSVAPQGGEDWVWSLQLDGFGRQGQVSSLARLQYAQADGRAELNYAGQLSEWYRETGVGLEQGFAINQNPSGDGQLVLQMQLDTSLAGTLSDDTRSLNFAAGDGQVLHYSDLYAYDANGQELGATLAYDPGQIILQIDDRGAAYPLTVDPLIYLEAERVGLDSVTGDDFGVSVAISGSTAVIGAQFHKVGSHTHQGVAYVFARSGMTWSQQAELSASDGAANDHFGYYVAISGDTAVIGAPDRNSGRGEAYVFGKPAGGWASGHETAKLTASDGAGSDTFGFSVAVSGDSIVIGAKGHNSNRGEAYVFVKPAGGWASGTETARLTASDGGADDGLGISVAISGNTAVVGADGHNSSQGEAYVFVKPASGWATATETAHLTASDGVSSDCFGQSVAISGNTVVVGAYAYNSNQGKAYVFVKPASGWVTGTERAILTASDGASDNYFGASIAISGDTVVVGAFGYSFDEGKAYVFVKPAGGWASGTENYQLSASDGAGNDYFGYSVAISAGTAVVGAFNHNSQKGAAYMYFPYRSDQDLGVEAVATPPSARPGQTVTFTASVTNYGPASAPDVLLSAPLPSGFTFVKSIASRGSYDSSTGSWSAGTLAFGITATLDIQARVNLIPSQTLTFSTSILGLDTNNANNSASAKLKVNTTDLALNGGFNTYPASSQIPTSWTAVHFSGTDGKDTATKKEGAASVRINGQASTTKTLTQTRTTSGSAGSSFLFNLYAKAASIPTTSGVVQAQVLLYNGTSLVQTKTITFPNGTYGFTKKSLAFTASGAYTRVVIKLTYSKASGKVWFDALSLLKAP